MPKKVRVNDTIPKLHGHIGNQRPARNIPGKVRHDGGVIHHDVDLTEATDHLIDHFLNTVFATHIRMDRERFRVVANTVKSRTGQKGRALFHPIRIALTGRSEGPELDLAIPAIDRGAELPTGAGLPEILGCRERAAAFVRALDHKPGGLEGL